MFRGGQRFVGCLASLAFVAIGAAFVAPASPVSADVDPAAAVIINEVYGGGGGTGAAYQNDFVELYNTTGAPVDLTGWSLQYKAATGAAWSSTINLIGSVPANGYFVLGGAGGATGAVLPTPDQSTSLNLSTTDANVALVSSTTTLTCWLTCSTDDTVVDLVGYGTGDTPAGRPAESPSASRSASRNGVSVNTGDNAEDFDPAVPSPAAVTPPPPSAPTTYSIAQIQGTAAV